MKIGEIFLFSGSVRKMADFYKTVLQLSNDSDDEKFQVLELDDIRLLIYNDGKRKPNNNQNISLSFAVSDVDAEYDRLKGFFKSKIHFLENPHTIESGYRIMSFYDPDGNQVYFRSETKQ